MALQKQFTIQLFARDGTTFRKSLSPRALKAPPAFHDRINGGQGELVLDLALPFDDFGEGSDVDFMHIAKVYAVDPDNPRGRLIYTGFVSRYEPYLGPDGEGVRVTCLGLGSLLTRSFYADADLTVSHSSEDPTVIGKAVIDHFNTVYGGSLVTHDASSVPAAVGTAVSVTFTDRTWFDCLKACGELAGAGWWWAVGRDGKYTFKAKPGAATHAFTVGRDVESLACPKDSEAVVNDVYVRRSGGTETTYTDAASQAAYGTGSPATGRVSKIISDTTLTSAAAADQRGNKELSDRKDAKVKATVVVNTNYDLESIRPGDTCAVRHFKTASTFFGDQNMLIASVRYTADRCTLELEGATADFGLALQGFVG